MMRFKLKNIDKSFLREYIRKGVVSARTLKRANILLLLDKEENCAKISDRLDVHRDTVYNVRNKYSSEGLNRALHDNARSGQPKKYHDKQEAEIIALACTDSPKGYKRWSLELMTKKLKKRKDMKTINRESIRLVLKKAKLNLG